MKSLSEALQYIQPIFEVGNPVKAECAVAEMWPHKDPNNLPPTNYFAELPDNWKATVKYHIETLLKKYLSGETAKDYFVCAYGKTTVGQLYSGVVKKYASLFREFARENVKSNPDYEYWVNSNKHQFDPTDIILYKNSAISKLSGLLGEDRWRSIRDGLRDLHEHHELIGVSLKEIKQIGEIDEFNIGEDTHQTISVTKAEYNNGSLIVTGTFNFRGAAIIKEDASVEELKSNTIILTCRTFGSRVGVGIDVKFPKSPALGKVEKSKWLKWLKINDRKPDLQTVQNALQDIANNNDIIKQMIKSAIKEGDYCLPFILIH